MKYKPVIGLEIHAQLNTKTKMFCDSLNNPDEKHPNINICPICMGHPGTLPVINKAALDKVIMAGLALNCSIARDTFFERKNYFYPDLPKGYQISQYLKPLCEHGTLRLRGGKEIRITRIHLEEDAGRLQHDSGSEYSLVDYNRAGVPLMELVTEPDFETGEEVREFAQELQLLLRYLNVSDADMEKGLMRVEVNISLTNEDGSWGTKVEIKNLNSISAAAASVDYEINRQKDVLESGETIKQETRGWDDVKRATFSQRSKEEAHDYRYFPEPDLPPLHFQEADIELFNMNRPLGNFFEHVASELLSFEKLSHLDRPDKEHQERLYKLASNYLITELQKHLALLGASPEDTKITPESFADLVVRVFHKQISSSAAQTVLQEMFETGLSPEQIIKEKDLGQVSDAAALESVIDAVIEKNQKAAEDYKAAKDASLKFLVGMAMRESKGKANPQLLEELIKQKLK